MAYIDFMAETETVHKCSRCEKDLDTTGYPKWCKACQAAYRREYRSLQGEMAETRGFAAGVSAMRDHLTNRFSRAPLASFTGAALVDWLRKEPGPRLPG